MFTAVNISNLFLSAIALQNVLKNMKDLKPHKSFFTCQDGKRTNIHMQGLQGTRKYKRAH